MNILKVQIFATTPDTCKVMVMGRLLNGDFYIGSLENVGVDDIGDAVEALAGGADAALAEKVKNPKSKDVLPS